MPFPWLLQLWFDAHLLFHPILPNHETPPRPERISRMDLTTPEGVIKLMESSKTVSEWNQNCDQIKAANGGSYPSFWSATIMVSGLASRVASAWGGDGDIHIHRYRRV